MGSGIAQTFAQSGFSVRLRDVSDAMLERGRALMGRMLDGAIQRGKLTPGQREAIVARVHTTTDLAEAVRGARLIVEAIFEEEEEKRKLFDEVARHAGADAFVVTNTSSLSVERLAGPFPEPGRFAGLHFFYPAQVNRLVEVVGGPNTAPETLERLEQLAYRLRKIPIRVRDRAGFAVNRFFVPYLNEATRLAEEKTATQATIEKVGRDLLGTTLGPFELMNVTGLPIAYHSEQSLERAFGPVYAPTGLLRGQFERGDPWDWKSTPVEPEREAAVRERFLGLILGIATRLVEEGVASAEATDRGAVVGLRWKQGPFALLSELGLDRGRVAVEAYAARWSGAFPVSKELLSRAGRGERSWPLASVRTEHRGPVAWVLLDRPEVMNALNSDTLRQVDEAFRALEHDSRVRCVVLAGSSNVFGAGADITEMAGKTISEGRAFGFFGQAVCRRIEEFPHPVIALVEGYALGGALELALAADFILASEDAQLGLPEATVGIHPGFGGLTRLTRLIGPGRTKLLVYTAGRENAREAERLGIVARLVPSDSAKEEAQRLAETISDRAPLALSWAKSVVNRGLDGSVEASLRLEGESAGHTFATEDRTEGMRAFLEKRPPKFEGR